MNVTITVPAAWLQSAHPMFESARGSDSALRGLLAEILVKAQDLLGEVVLEPVAGDSVILAAPATASADQAGAQVVRISTYLPQSLASYVASVARVSGMTPGVATKALIWRFINAGGGVESACDSVDESEMAALVRRIGGRQVRPEQVAAFCNIDSALKDGRIGLVEASTGVGKTLASVFAAIGWIQREAKSCCIAVPTLALLAQVVAEYRRVESAMRDQEIAPPLRVFMGRREFVSSAAMALLSQSQSALEQWPLAFEWARGGARPRTDDGIESCWLVAELLRLEPSFPIDEVILGDSPANDDLGYVAYRSQFMSGDGDGGVDRASSSPDAPSLLLCTHAMLAQDMRRKLICAGRDQQYAELNAGVFELLAKIGQLDKAERKASSDLIVEARRKMGEVIGSREDLVGILPRYDALIVDEAHALESNFSQALSDNLALRKVVRLLRQYKEQGGRVTAQAIEEVAGLIYSLHRSVPTKGDLMPLSSTRLVESRQSLAKIVELLAPLADKKHGRGSRERAQTLAQLRRAVNLIRLALGKAHSRSYLRLSPQRAYPQVFVGRDNVESVLQMMWSSLKAGIALSATLYLYRSSGPHANYMAGLLGIPQDRRAEFAPIEARWLMDCIESVHTPEGPRALVLTPPSRRDRLDEQEYARATGLWLDALAQQLREIHASAAGGVLVLNTSYEAVNGLVQRLGQMPSSGEGERDGQVLPLVYAREGSSVSLQAKEFLQMRQDGLKPIWLALGSAWTGLDVGGHEPMEALLGLPALLPQEDQVLTDLVVPRLPFGNNNSITHLRRIMMSPSVPWDMLDAAFRFRQALGRLVRRKGLTRNRRIWVLDGRLARPDAKASLAVFWAPINRIVQHLSSRA